MEFSNMPRTTRNFHKLHPTDFVTPALITLAAVTVFWMGCFPLQSVAQQSGQKTFSSAEQASTALVTAAQSNDEKAMLEILGPEGKQIVSSGDEAEDAQNRANFAKRYEEMHRLVKEPDGTTVLYIGPHNWPTPIPIVNKGSAWFFDTEAGKKEILFRRVGKNETSAIRVCQELVTAEKEYYSAHHNEYAHKFFSDDGQHNGLYWKASAAEPQSPIGPLLAAAVIQSNDQSAAPTPYRGYYFRALEPQANPPGSSFAFIAFPAEYRSSGVMTFVVTEKGLIYEKDLGKKTEAVAKAMNKFHANATWKKAELPQPQADTSTQSAQR
jgi:hypothetical protein